MELFIGGVYTVKDDTVKVSAEAKESTGEKLPRLLTWDDVKIEGLNTDRVTAIEIHCVAGDVVFAKITYWHENPKTHEIETNTENFHLKNFSFQTSMRTTDINWEPMRKEMLGLQT
jgi:hypothetical protein